MPRPSNTQERRSQITTALVKVMAQKGYDGASIGEIAGAAGLTPGLLHYHFGSKQEILLEALADLVAHHEAALDARVAAAGDDALAALAAFIDLHLGLGADADPEALACWILLSGEALRTARVRQAFERALRSLVERLAGLIHRGVAQRVLACDDVDAAAAALIAAIQGYLVLAATARDLIPRGSAARSTRRMAEGLLRPTRPLPPPVRPGRARRR